MFRRVAFFAYGTFSYLAFLATFLYAIAFVEGIAVPTRLDGPAVGPIGVSLLIDTILLGIFAVQHSVMARRGFKAWWTRVVPQEMERSTFVLFASAALALLVWQWRPLGGTVWQVDIAAGRAALMAASALGWTTVLVATFLINHFDLFGLRQSWYALRGKRYQRVALATPWLYRFVRHPLYLGFVIAFWSAPTMTLAHLVFAIATTAYILIAIRLEERDLIAEHGAAYETYRRQVPMLLPASRPAAVVMTVERAATGRTAVKNTLVLVLPVLAVLGLELMLRF